MAVYELFILFLMVKLFLCIILYATNFMWNWRWHLHTQCPMTEMGNLYLKWHLVVYMLAEIYLAEMWMADIKSNSRRECKCHGPSCIL